MKRNLLHYVILIGGFLFLIGLVIDAGKKLQPGVVGSQIHTSEIPHLTMPPATGGKTNLLTQFLAHVKTPLGLLLLQILVILFVSKIFAMLFMQIKQPSVVGEMIAGIFLGPSVVGYFFPDFSAFLFPVNSLNNLQLLSQLGLILFMFIIGMELDIEKLKSKAHNAIVISHASIVFPYFLGVSAAYFLFEQYAPPGVSFTVFALFMGIAISITAFPVLARIMQERGLTRTPLGTMAITCAAFDDVSAWCILATVIAIAQ